MKREYHFVSRLSDEHMADLVTLYHGEWWTRTRTPEDVAAVCENSDLIIGLVHEPDGRLVGFGRVLTDWRFVAVVLDVIVAAELRLQGLGRALMEHLVSHPRLREVRSIELVCQPELFEFYEKWGFTRRVGRSTLMRRTGEATLLDSDTRRGEREE
jgi:GNAT superfamily N-acetyltransferase